MVATWTAGQKVRTSDLLKLPGGIVARHTRSSNGTATTATTQSGAQKLLEIDASLQAGVLYHVYTNAFEILSSVQDDLVNINLTYTTDGTAPAVTSTLLAETFVLCRGNSAAQPVTTKVSAFYTPSTALTLKVLMSYYRAAGSGSVRTDTNFGSASRPTTLVIEAMGTDPGSTGTDF